MNIPKDLHALASQYETQIKDTIVQRFGVEPQDLRVLLEEEQGVYMSNKDPERICCLVVGISSGLLYLVSAKVVGDGDKPQDFLADVIA
ncbi:MAG: hypothetical protein KAR24_01570 [Candidatus Pacebacteria bacterium]|nr:hypothetical protein [Candidatus Paceibacterota bacterium]